jgi:hypothetical protein
MKLGPWFDWLVVAIAGIVLAFVFLTFLTGHGPVD